MEKSITKIINLQRSEQNERSIELSEGERETGNDLVRGGSEALSEVRSGREAGDSISAGHGDMDVQPLLELTADEREKKLLKQPIMRYGRKWREYMEENH